MVGCKIISFNGIYRRKNLGHPSLNLKEKKKGVQINIEAISYHTENRSTLSMLLILTISLQQIF